MRSSEQQERIRPGQVVARGRYVLLEELGRGGLATVFRAKDACDGSEVALKVLCDRYVGRPEREERLRREFDYAARVDHPAVIRVKELGVLEDGRPFFSMELVPGRPLSGIISGSGGLPFPRTRRLARAIAMALDAVHSAGIVHRDIKPENVLVLDGDRVKLIDFGMAGDDDAPAVPAGHRSRLTRANDLLGTHEYMAPEQVFKAPPRRAMDVFALGVVMYEMLSSITPYSGMKAREYVELQTAGDPCLRSADRWARLKGAPVAFAELVDNCRRREPGDRPGDMQEVIRRLDALDRVGSSPALVPVRVPAAVVASVVTDLQPIVVRESFKERSRIRPSPVIWIGAAAVTLAMLLGPQVMPGSRMVGAAEAPRTTSVAAVTADASAFAEPMHASMPYPSPARTSVGEVVELSADPPQPHEPDLGNASEAPGTARGVTSGRAKRAIPRATRPVSMPSPTPARCERILAAAKAAFDSYNWKAVLEHTSEPACWSRRREERLTMRTEALMEEERWTECVRTGRRSAEPRVRRFAERCQKRLDTIVHEP